MYKIILKKNSSTFRVVEQAQNITVKTQDKTINVQSVGKRGLPGQNGATGPAGNDGAQGPQGNPGTNGVGVPVGGTTGQILAKTSPSDYDTEWIDSSAAADMTKAVYDPQNVSDDAFNQDNMTDGATNKNYTATEKTKLAGIEDGAEVNVQADWDESDDTNDAFIKNKPDITSLDDNAIAYAVALG